jgi:hypothetical protein
LRVEGRALLTVPGNLSGRRRTRLLVLQQDGQDHSSPNFPSRTDGAIGRLAIGETCPGLGRSDPSSIVHASDAPCPEREPTARLLSQGRSPEFGLLRRNSRHANIILSTGAEGSPRLRNSPEASALRD